MSCRVTGDGDYALPPVRKPAIKKSGSSPKKKKHITLDTNGKSNIWSSGDSTRKETTAKTDTSTTEASNQSKKQGTKTGGTSAGTSSGKQGQKTGSGGQATNRSDQSSSTQNTQKPPVDNSNKSSFQTTIPVFKDLNTKGFETPDLRTKTNVDIHIKGDDTQAVSVEEQADGSTIVYFTGSEMYAVIPPGQPKKPKPMILYDQQTNTIAFSNIKGNGFEVKLLDPNNENHKDRYPNDLTTGANILLKNCHAKHVDTAEKVKTGQKGLTQTIVFENAVVDEFDTLGDNYITIGENTVINNADNHCDDANGNNYTYWASDDKGTVNRDKNSTTSNGNGQSGYTLSEGYRWIHGNENATSISNTEGVTNKKIKYNNKKETLIDVDYSDAYLCRHFGDVDIYFRGTGSKSNYAKKIINYKKGNTLFIDINGTKVTFSDKSKGNIFYDADTNTLMFEGLKELEINYSAEEAEKDKLALFQNKEGTDMSSSGTDMSVHLYIKDCSCKTVNCMETEATEDDFKFGLKEKPAQDVLVFENSTVENLYTNNDIVYVDKKSSIDKYAGDEKTQIDSSGRTDFKKDNSIKDVKNQFRTRSSLDLSGKEGFSDIKSDNFLLERSMNGINVFVQGDASEIKVSNSHIYKKEKAEETKSKTAESEKIPATEIRIKNTFIKIPEQLEESEKPKVYYDAGTDAIILENVKDAEVVSIRGSKTKIYLKNSTCTKIDTQEYAVSKNGDKKSYVLSNYKAANSERDIIYIDENSSVEELLTNADDVHLEDGASVKKYAGVNTTVFGFNTTDSGSQDLEKINAFSEKHITKGTKQDTIRKTKLLPGKFGSYKEIIRSH